MINLVKLCHLDEDIIALTVRALSTVFDPCGGRVTAVVSTDAKTVQRICRRKAEHHTCGIAAALNNLKVKLNDNLILQGNLIEYEIGLVGGGGVGLNAVFVLGDRPRARKNRIGLIDHNRILVNEERLDVLCPNLISLLGEVDVIRLEVFSHGHTIYGEILLKVNRLEPGCISLAIDLHCRNEVAVLGSELTVRIVIGNGHAENVNDVCIREVGVHTLKHGLKSLCGLGTGLLKAVNVVTAKEEKNLAGLHVLNKSVVGYLPVVGGSSANTHVVCKNVLAKVTLPAVPEVNRGRAGKNYTALIRILILIVKVLNSSLIGGFVYVVFHISDKFIYCRLICNNRNLSKLNRAVLTAEGCVEVGVAGSLILVPYLAAKEKVDIAVIKHSGHIHVCRCRI